MMSAPAQLPFAPRPIPDESLSSWLLRVAAANYITLAELLDDLEFRYSGASRPPSLDFNIPPLFLDSISAFCRVSLDRIRALDLSQRLPHLKTVLLLRFPGKFSWCPRAKWERLAYAFCPLCLADQRVNYVRWEWSFACITRCSTHRIPLQTGCPACGEPDPLLFSPPACAASVKCWSCDYDLIQVVEPANVCVDEKLIQAVEDAYRLALLGRLSAEIADGVKPEAIVKTITESLRQQLQNTGLQENPEEGPLKTRWDHAAENIPSIGLNMELVAEASLQIRNMPVSAA